MPYDDGDLDHHHDLNDHHDDEVDITTQLLAADRTPVSFMLTWTRGDGTQGKRE